MNKERGLTFEEDLIKRFISTVSNSDRSLMITINKLKVRIHEQYLNNEDLDPKLKSNLEELHSLLHIYKVNEYSYKIILNQIMINDTNPQKNTDEKYILEKLLE
jgi:hypothetical protein